ncbi:hypothetical protein N9242_00975 [Vicingaceae bacterium]|nr:hypothetical protein [Vicingaceae bacterium]
MTDSYKEKISDIRSDSSGITKDQVNKNLTKGSYPAIYIEHMSEFVIDNGTIYFNDVKISTPGLTVIDLVKRMREAGLNAYITRDQISMLPAELLIDFSNRSTVLKDIDISPKNMDEIHGKHVLNIPGLEETSIDRDIISMHSESISVKYSTDNPLYSFYIEDNKIYTNGLRHDTQAMIEYKINKFFIFIGKENIIELSNLCANAENSLSKTILIDGINSYNWDRI